MAARQLRRGCHDRGAVSAAEALRAAYASDVRVIVDGESFVLEACAHRALMVRGGQS